jgi:uncharacterized cofD-like protein
MIVMGPGKLHTSVITNLLIDGVADAVRKSKAKKVFVCNIMTQPYVTDNFTVSKHVQELEKYLGKNVIEYVIANTSYPDEEVLKYFNEVESSLVKLDKENLGNVKVVEGEFLNKSREFKWNELGLLTHDADKTATALIKIL